jgi:alpha-amylase
VEQIHDGVDEGTGLSYGFHGYWARDWTNLDLTLEQRPSALVQKHTHRIILDGVINHTGPVTAEEIWANDWVRTGPNCDYKSFENTTACTLVSNLPDIKNKSLQMLLYLLFLSKNGKKEGRYEQEIKEIDAFFARTGYPRAQNITSSNG